MILTNTYKTRAFSLLPLLRLIHREQTWKLWQSIALTQEHCVPEEEIQVCSEGLLRGSRVKGVLPNRPHHIWYCRNHMIFDLGAAALMGGLAQ
jgi:hypothetical protein